MVKESLENYKKSLIEEEVAKKLIELHDFEVPSDPPQEGAELFGGKKTEGALFFGYRHTIHKRSRVGTGAFAPGNCKHKAKIHT
jgi:hypothetical protein